MTEIGRERKNDWQGKFTLAPLFQSRTITESKSKWLVSLFVSNFEDMLTSIEAHIKIVFLSGLEVTFKSTKYKFPPSDNGFRNDLLFPFNVWKLFFFFFQNKALSLH